VVDDFKKQLPKADIYVYDNNSKDDTAKIAAEHGAIVKRETLQGKGRVVRSMFRDINAKYFIMVDGDDTYPAEHAQALLEPLLEGTADMCVGDRLSNGTYGKENDRKFHGFGNNLVRFLIKLIYKFEFHDVMTGYRSFTELFAKTFPVTSKNFEIETEMSIHAADKGWHIVNVPIEYRDRPDGSESKLNTISDGYKVLCMILTLFKDYHPLMMFSLIALFFVLIGSIIGLPVIVEFLKTGFVPKLPSTILAASFVFIGFLFLTSGLILDTVVKGNCKQYLLEVSNTAYMLQVRDKFDNYRYD
ncbi:MAG: glycosyltransferase, partial [Eggerthellaceae bacterium]|nr:glycosyltransferase [Eggerthellaceae bacterium]